MTPESLTNKLSTVYRIASNPAQVVKLFHSNSLEAFQEAELHRTASTLSIGVVKFVETHIEGGHLGIVMEACQWENVGQVLERVRVEGLRRWQERELLVIIYGMMRTVQTLHAAGLAHCGLGLENWLISQRSSLKLTDFGSAKYTSEPFNGRNRLFCEDTTQLGKNLYQMTLFRPCRYAAECPLDLMHSDIASKATRAGYSQSLGELIWALLANQWTLQGCIDLAGQGLGR